MPPVKLRPRLTALDKAYRAELKSLRIAERWSQSDLAHVAGLPSDLY